MSTDYSAANITGQSDDRLEHRRRLEQNLTPTQRTAYRRTHGLFRDVLDTALATATLLPAAYMGAALTAPGEVSSKWGGGIPAKGTVSDPTGEGAVRGLMSGGEHHTNPPPGPDAQLAELEALARGWRDAGYPIHQLASRLAARLEPDQGNAGWRGDEKLDAENIGSGNCGGCDCWQPGTNKHRLRRVRTSPDLDLCDACRKDWKRTQDRDLDADIWVWSEQRRRHIERTDGKAS